MKKLLSLVLACVLLLAMLISVAGAEVPALKGPGNVTLKRLGGNVSFDVNADYMGGHHQGSHRLRR